MRAMVLLKQKTPLVAMDLPDPAPGPSEVRLKVLACGVCRTDLHVVDAELTEPKLPLVPGHEIVGEVEALGAGVTALSIGQRVGVGWLGHACHHCPYCLSNRENLCDTPIFTGYHPRRRLRDAHGGRRRLRLSVAEPGRRRGRDRTPCCAQG